MSEILDASGKTTADTRPWWKRAVATARATWKVWLPIVISVVAVIISSVSAWNAHFARVQSRSLAKLDFRPDLRVHAWFHESAGFPPHYTIHNVGPVDASQVSSIRMFSHRYYAEADKVAATVGGSENETFIDNLGPQKVATFRFHEGWLNTNARLHTPVQHNVLEIRLSYRRSQDLQHYDVSAFYFVNPDGRWVSESDNSLREPLYGTLMAAIAKHRSHPPVDFLLPSFRDRDILHDNKGP